MTEPSWTRAALRGLVQDHPIYLRDAHAGEVEIPTWLAEVAGDVGLEDSQEALEQIHPEDRSAVIEAFLQALARPGVLIPATARRRLRDGVYRPYDLVWVNLLSHPDVGGILAVESHATGEVVEAPVRGDAGEHTAAMWMILHLDDAGAIVEARGQVEALLGYGSDELLGHPPTHFIHPDSVADSIGLWLGLRSGTGGTATSRRRWLRKGGEEIWLESNYLSEEDEEGRPRILVVVRDITARLAEERELEESRARSDALAEEMRSLAADNEALAADFRALADEVPSAVFRCDLDGRVVMHNSRWEEIVAHAGARLHDVVDPDVHIELDTALATVGAGRGERLTLEVPSPDGLRSWRITLRSLHPGGVGRRAVVGSLEDVTATVTLRRQAERDGLTGLLNRTALLAQLDEVMRREVPMWVLFCDLDGFKEVNDLHGHAAGDAVLAEVGRRLRDAVRPGDVVARFGGDEFVLVCEGLGESGAGALIRRVEDALSPTIEFDGGTWEPAVSIGATPAAPTDSADELIARADEAMFEVKRARQRRRA